MPLTGEEIRSRLGDLGAKWSVYEGTKTSEAQTFRTPARDSHLRTKR